MSTLDSSRCNSSPPPQAPAQWYRFLINNFFIDSLSVVHSDNIRQADNQVVGQLTRLSCSSSFRSEIKHSSRFKIRQQCHKHRCYTFNIAAATLSVIRQRKGKDLILISDLITVKEMMTYFNLNNPGEKQCWGKKSSHLHYSDKVVKMMMVIYI